MRNTCIYKLKLPLAILLVISQAGFNSCQKKYDSNGSQSLKIDSVTYLDFTGVKFTYENDRIGSVNRYIYPDNQRVNKVVYNYSNNKIAEKIRISLLSGNTIWQTLYSYTPAGKLASVRISIPTGTPGVYNLHAKFNINYTADVIASSEYFEYLFDTIHPTTYYMYKYESLNGNIVKSMVEPAGLGAETYTYTSTTKENIFLKDDFFIKDYQALNLENPGLNFSVLLPFFINKNETQLVTTTAQTIFSFKSIRDNNGRATSATIYDNGGFGPFPVRSWNFYYK